MATIHPLEPSLMGVTQLSESVNLQIVKLTIDYNIYNITENIKNFMLIITSFATL